MLSVKVKLADPGQGKLDEVKEEPRDEEEGPARTVPPLKIKLSQGQTAAAVADEGGSAATSVYTHTDNATYKSPSKSPGVGVSCVV